MIGVRPGKRFSYVSIGRMEDNEVSKDIMNELIKVKEHFPKKTTGIMDILLVARSPYNNRIYIFTPLYLGSLNRIKPFLDQSPEYLKKIPECFDQLLEGLNELHFKKNLAHGDIKPENILFTFVTDPSPKLICDIADLDGLLMEKKFFDARYFPFILQITGKEDNFKHDRFSMALSFLEIIETLTRPKNPSLSQKINSYHRLADEIREAHGDKLNAEKKKNLSDSFTDLTKEIVKNLEDNLSDCQTGKNKEMNTCALYQEKYIDYIKKNFSEIHLHD
jgi:hypothetical protein